MRLITSAFLHKMVHSTLESSALRDQSNAFFLAPSSVIFARRRCDHCDHWITKGAASVRCPSCKQIYHDECLGELDCGVTSAVLRRSRRAGISRNWKCGKCDIPETAKNGQSKTNARASYSRLQTTETPQLKDTFAGPKRLSFGTVSVEQNNATDHAALCTSPPHKHLVRADSGEVGLAGDPPLLEKEGKEARRQSLTLETSTNAQYKLLPLNARDKIQALSNATSYTSDSVGMAHFATKGKKKVTALIRSPLVSSLTPAAKRIRKQASTVSKSAKKLHSARRVVGLRLSKRTILYHRRIRAARRISTKGKESQLDACTTRSANSFAAALATATAGDATYDDL